MYVTNGVFILNDKFDPMASELYLTKGIEQKEFRMIQYDINAGVGNAFNASYYDPRNDGALRFKMYLRTNVNNEIVTNADFTNVQFKTAYIASAVQFGSAYQMWNNYSSISLSIQSINNEYLIIGPSSWADQDQIDQLVEGLYFIYVTGSQFGNNSFTL